MVQSFHDVAEWRRSTASASASPPTCWESPASRTTRWCAACTHDGALSAPSSGPMADRRLIKAPEAQSSIFNRHLPQGHLRLDFRDFVGELALELRQRRLDGLSPGWVEQLKRQAAARRAHVGSILRESGSPTIRSHRALDPEERVCLPWPSAAGGRRPPRRDESGKVPFSALQSSALKRSRLDSGGTARRGFSPVKTRRTSSTTIRAISRRVSMRRAPGMRHQDHAVVVEERRSDRGLVLVDVEPRSRERPRLESPRQSGLFDDRAPRGV